MLRLPSTLISLSSRDISDHFNHINEEKSRDGAVVVIQQANDQNLFIEESQNCPWGDGDSSFSPRESSSIQGRLPGSTDEPVGNVAHSAFNYISRSPSPGSNETNNETKLHTPTNDDDHTSFPGPPPLLNLGYHSGFEAEEGFLATGLEHPLLGLTHEHVQTADQLLEVSSSFLNHAFEYGGFVENQSEVSEMFDIPHPERAHILNVHRLRARGPIPRSPLYRSHAASKSPERTDTVGTTPGVAHHTTSSVLLSQPARRPRCYRPRTISYSFEESERASAAYDDGYLSDRNSNDNVSLRNQSKTLHDELRGSSLQSSSAASNMPSLPSLPPSRSVSQQTVPDSIRFGKNEEEDMSSQYVDNLTSSNPVGLTKSEGMRRSFSPQLPLPPPFSAASRHASSTASARSTPCEESRLRDPISTSERILSYGLDYSANEDPRYLPRLSTSLQQHSRAFSGSTLSSLVSLPFRVYSAYRDRSPIQSRNPSPLSVPTPRNGSRGSAQNAPQLNTPHSRLQVYDDRIPTSLQPQTPQHLPEARHQSRHHPSYTAPAAARRRQSPTLHQLGRNRRQTTRTDSPPGLGTPGFSGLYGGQENTDEEVNFDRAARRLWTLASTRRAERSLSHTPERELSMADDRGNYF